MYRATTSNSGDFCAYGLCLSGATWPGTGAPSSDDIDVVVDIEHVAPGARQDGDADLRVDDVSATLRFREGRVCVTREPMPRVRFQLRQPLSAEALAHPYLAFPAAVVNHWCRRAAFHAGALGVDGRAVVLLGQKESGKSSTVAYAAHQGIEVLCDDLLVVDGKTAWSGPRFVDLREEAAHRWGGRPLGIIGARNRWRLSVPEIVPAMPIAAFVQLGWGDTVSVTRLVHPLAAAAILDSRALGIGPSRADMLFDLLELPVFRIERPRRLAVLPDVLDALTNLAVSV